MSTQPECELLEAMRSLARASKGGSPAYSAYHIYRALELIREHPRGRPVLARRLGLGEASARTLLRRLRSWGLVESGYRGNRLTEKGARLLEAVRSSVEILDLGELVWGGAVGAYTPHVNPPVDMVSVYRIRDYLVLHGCRETIVGGYTGSGPTFPGVPGEVAEELMRALPRRGRGLIVIAPRRCATNIFDAIIDIILDQCKLGG